MKKLVLLLVAMLMLSGCTKNEFKVNYDKMQAVDENINGYTMDLRVYGNYNDKKISDDIRINNYRDIKYQIMISNYGDSKGKPSNDTDQIIQSSIIYVSNGNTYVYDQNVGYILSDSDVKYDEPSLYLKGLNNISKIYETKEETVGDITYTVYDVKYNKNFISELVKDTSISGIDIKRDVEGQVYLTRAGYVSRIIYNVEDVTINVGYFNIGLSSDIILPIEIEGEV